MDVILFAGMWGLTVILDGNEAITGVIVVGSSASAIFFLELLVV